MDTKNLDSKINKYLTLAGGISVAATGANAQVVYTDINPDYLLSGNMSVYTLDLNNDSNPDFMLMTLDTLISSVSSTSSYTVTYNINVDAATINPAATSNAWIGSNGPYSSGPFSLSQGALIGSSGNFGSNSSSSFGYPIAGNVQFSVIYNGVPAYNSTTQVGDFEFDQEGILGLRFNINNNIHYGWARVEYTSGGVLSIKDYAYDATANTAITAGETGSGLVSVKENENSVQINSFNNNLQIELFNDVSNAQLKITNLSGQEVISKVMNSSKEIISLNEYSSGIYLATVTSDEIVTTKKIYIR